MPLAATGTDLTEHIIITTATLRTIIQMVFARMITTIKQVATPPQFLHQRARLNLYPQRPNCKSQSNRLMAIQTLKLITLLLVLA